MGEVENFRHGMEIDEDNILEAYLTMATEDYIPLVEKLAESLYYFSNRKLILYGINFNLSKQYPNIVFRRIDVDDFKILPIDKDKKFLKLTTLKATVCKDALDRGLERGVFLDSDCIVKENIDSVFTYSYLSHYPKEENAEYPLASRHCFDYVIRDGAGNPWDEDWVWHDDRTVEWPLMQYMGVEKSSCHLIMTPIFVFTKACYDFIDEWESLCRDEELAKDPVYYCPLADETAFNVLLWKYKANKTLPISFMNIIDVNTARVFYEDGREDMDIESRWQYIPKNKDTVVIFHGCREPDKLGEVIEYMRDRKTRASEKVVTEFSKKSFCGISNSSGKYKIGIIGTGAVIPPDGHGAVEEIIWRSSKEFEKRGCAVEIALPYNHDWRDYDIVHVHTANQAVMLKEQNVPYIFTIHDINVYLMGEDSFVYKENLEAVKNSLLTLVPSRYFVNLFPGYEHKIKYLSHGVDTDFYKPVSNILKDTPRLLCVAKNFALSLGDGPLEDNKGFVCSYEAAKKKGWHITIAGPNAEFLKEFGYDFDYDKLTIIDRDVGKEELRDLYHSHDIFMAMSMVESGQPCLVILEALACGLPVVATRKDRYELGGVTFLNRDVDDICIALSDIEDNYEEYSQEALSAAGEMSWSKICDETLGYYKLYDKRKFRVAQISTPMMTIPPKGWGAIEKIIWEYKNGLERLGFDVEIKRWDFDGFDKFDIVHCHFADQAQTLADRGIPYIFTMHDHHAYVHGKDSSCYAQNVKAINESVMSIVPSEYLLDYFEVADKGKLIFIPHGVDCDIYSPIPKSDDVTLLSVGRNGLCGDNYFDRKGFSFSVNAAKDLNIPIAVAGPTEGNADFFSKNKELIWEKLEIKYDLSDDDIKELYRKTHILVHATSVEAGHPPLTVLEAMACGNPVIGTFMGEGVLYPRLTVGRDCEEIKKAIEYAISNYDFLSKWHRDKALEYKWSSVVEKISDIYRNLSIGLR